MKPRRLAALVLSEAGTIHADRRQDTKQMLGRTSSATVLEL